MTDSRTLKERNEQDVNAVFIAAEAGGVDYSTSRRARELYRRATDFERLARAALKALDAEGLANLWPVNSDYGQDAEQSGHEHAVKTAEAAIAAALKAAVEEAT